MAVAIAVRRGLSSLKPNGHYSFRCFSSTKPHMESIEAEEDDDVVQTSGIGRPLSHVLKQLNKKVPESLISLRTQPDGFSVKYIPWHILNRIMNLHAPGPQHHLFTRYKIRIGCLLGYTLWD